MVRRARHDEWPMNQRHVAQIGGRSWQYNPGDERCAACYTREQRVDSPPPPGAHVSTPHPEGKGWRIYWIFLAVVFGLFACLLAGWLPPELMACAAGVC